MANEADLDEARRAQLADRLDRTRDQMTEMGVDVMLIRSTDRYLNEYVPADESTRVWLTGFTGSTGDALITHDRAFLAVDGRYWLRAEAEIDLARWEILRVKLGSGIEEALVERLGNLARETDGTKLRIGYEPDKLTPKILTRLESAVPGATWKPLFPSPVEKARGSERPVPREPGIRTIDEARAGRTVTEKLGEVASALEALGAEAILVQRLDEIMWLANLRGSEMPYQATFKCIALATPERLFLGIDPSKVPGPVRRAREAVLFVPEAELWTLVGKKAKRKRVAFDAENNTLEARMKLTKAGAEIIEVSAPLQALRARKNPAELASMQEAFRRADTVVAGAIEWVCAAVDAGDRVTEASFAEEVTRRFMEAGATGLAFKVISAAGKNAAQIHYGEPNKRRVLKPGEILLLDTGAYFQDGYATDLTRTFLLGGKKQGATDEQRRLYTLVLRAAITGMRALIPEGTRGAQLDALVRAPLWAEGLDYNHGTGHGVGINVHEMPPRVAPSSLTPLEVGQVFSIEPGVYLPSFGGIRIENLCTLEPATAVPGFMQVKPLTFSPLDERLIDPKRLTTEEKSFVKWFQKQHEAAKGPTPQGRARARKTTSRKKAARRPR